MMCAKMCLQFEEPMHYEKFDTKNFHANSYTEDFIFQNVSKGFIILAFVVVGIF